MRATELVPATTPVVFFPISVPLMPNAVVMGNVPFPIGLTLPGWLPCRTDLSGSKRAKMIDDSPVTKNCGTTTKTLCIPYKTEAQKCGVTKDQKKRVRTRMIPALSLKLVFGELWPCSCKLVSFTSKRLSWALGLRMTIRDRSSGRLSKEEDPDRKPSSTPPCSSSSPPTKNWTSSSFDLLYGVARVSDIRMSSTPSAGSVKMASASYKRILIQKTIEHQTRHCPYQ